MKKKEISPRKPGDTDVSYCIRNGIKVYPVRAGQNWFVEVDNNGRRKRFDKPIANGYILRSDKMEPIEKTYTFYANKLKETEDSQTLDRDRESNDKV